jgi:hypothetical protein
MGRIKRQAFCEIDTISPDGGFAQGDYAFTLSLINVPTCWSVFRPRSNAPSFHAFSSHPEGMTDTQCSNLMFPHP